MPKCVVVAPRAGSLLFTRCPLSPVRVCVPCLVRVCVRAYFAAAQLDNTGDARVDQKELEAYLRRETPDLTKRDAWIIMNCADTNNGATDTGWRGCDDYYTMRPSRCGCCDDEDFTSNEMCCACGGGSLV